MSDNPSIVNLRSSARIYNLALFISYRQNSFCLNLSHSLPTVCKVLSVSFFCLSAVHFLAVISIYSTLYIVKLPSSNSTPNSISTPTQLHLHFKSIKLLQELSWSYALWSYLVCTTVGKFGVDPTKCLN